MSAADGGVKAFHMFLFFCHCGFLFILPVVPFRLRFFYCGLARREARLRKKMDKEGEEAPSPETPSSDDTTTAKSRSGPSGWQKWKVRKDNVTKAKWAGQQTVWSAGRCLNFGVQRVELSPEQRSVGVQTEFPNTYFRPVPTSSVRSEGAN